MSDKHDLFGRRFGALVATMPTSQRRAGSVVWQLICDCGLKVFRTRESLLRNPDANASCGCLKSGRASLFARDLTGHRFGQLVAISAQGSEANRGLRWLCTCDCGQSTVARAKDLRLGTTKSCGCRKRATKEPKPVKRGDRFGSLVVVCDFEEERDCGARVFLCRCDCGGASIVRGTLLRLGQTKSCGCARRLGRKKAETHRQVSYLTAGESLPEVMATVRQRLDMAAGIR